MEPREAVRVIPSVLPEISSHQARPRALPQASIFA